MAMEWYFAYKDELEKVFRQAEERTSTFPAPFQQEGLDYLARFNPLREDSTRNYICYLLPFWLQELTGLPRNMPQAVTWQRVRHGPLFNSR